MSIDVVSAASRPFAGEHAGRSVLVWDLPTRLFHWLLVVCFAGAYVSGDADRWRTLHAMFGYTVGGLVAFRVLWGVFGTRYARFTGFVFAPRAVLAYLRSLLAGPPRHYVGHNPAGSWAALALLVLVALTALSGWATFTEIGPEWLEDVHEALADATLMLVGVHVGAVLFSSWRHGENLVRAMVDGRKRAAPALAAAGSRWVVGAALVAAVIAFWGGWIPAPGVQRGTGVTALQAVVSPAQRASKESDRPRRTRKERRDRADD